MNLKPSPLTFAEVERIEETIKSIGHYRRDNNASYIDGRHLTDALSRNGFAIVRKADLNNGR